MNKFIEDNLVNGHKSNLFVYEATFNPNYVGSEAIELKERYLQLQAMDEELERIIFRSVINEQFIEDGQDFKLTEFEALMLKLIGVDKLSDNQLQELYEERNEQMGLGFELMKYGLPDERRKEFNLQKREYLKSSYLYERILRLHTEKLDLMVDIIQAYIDNSGQSKDYKPPHKTGKREKRWKELFGEEVPTIGQLLANAKATVNRARQHLDSIQELQ